MEIEYLAITRNNIILAQSASGDGDFDIAINEILISKDLSNERMRVDKLGYRFFILHNKKELNVIAACDVDAQADQAFRILESIQKTVLTSYANKWEVSSSFDLQSDFEPQLRNTILAHSKTLQIQPTEIDDSDQILANLGKSIESDHKNAQNENTFTEVSEAHNSPSYTRLKLKLFVSKYRWIFLSIIILFILLIILIIMFITP
ncbi:hypothetical protein TVAG_360030 [Trichomonas vaginalis G3]|uniref:Longin domain-containing protein n=1 Tax=Trichomonas vaginalis (strain ATCC PRA-98 / G3) TaxID=412133 RepID=A2DTC2_TRIV3|nr:SNAP receptor protein [Trichomonas vaginalis G3]EAY16394.1 hypothetical protein TVAG_360030 [Trichomonas vaginalis G3]KAI5488378.1 SNAP receptor protein [Trichomonas vaginalis G3]|eukprot:XP_001328617.1 hypothetical protein [Trichomonas vaginalis G3]